MPDCSVLFLVCHTYVLSRKSMRGRSTISASMAALFLLAAAFPFPLIWFSSLLICLMQSSIINWKLQDGEKKKKRREWRNSVTETNIHHLVSGSSTRLKSSLQWWKVHKCKILQVLQTKNNISLRIIVHRTNLCTVLIFPPCFCSVTVLFMTL